MLDAVTPTAKTRLASYERRYRDLARQLSEIGWIASGSIAQRASRCGKPNCACHKQPPRLHGPYWHFTAKIDAKTVNKRLTENEARLYQEWIANDRKVHTMLAEMREIAANAQALILADEASHTTPNRPSTASPETRQPSSRRRATST